MRQSRMIAIALSGLLLWGIHTIDGRAEDYSFDLSEVEKKPYEYAASLSVDPAVAWLNRDSLFYRLKYGDDGESVNDDYRATLEASGSYAISQTKIAAAGKYDVTYAEDEWADDALLYELYLQSALNSNLTVWLGKKVIKWGRGYIWNPAAFVGRQKDVNDVDATQEGYYLATGEFVKSFDGRLRTFSIAPVIMPSGEDVNEDFSDVHSTNVALSAYLLFADTDIGFYGFTDDHGQWKVGGDAARNLLTNWEIHAEWAYEDASEHLYLDQDYSLQRTSRNVTNILVGTRYLAPSNTTVIAEYLHNGGGYSQDEMNNFFEAAELALDEGKRELLPTVKSFQKDELSRQFLMQDYLYLKLSQPEPFGILYFTPSAFVIYNLNDNSLRLGCDVKYTRVTNLEFTLRQQYFSQEPFTEFGEKINTYKIDLTVEKYF